MSATELPPVADVQNYGLELIDELYGARLQDGGPGFDVTLQLLAEVWGVQQLEDEELFRSFDDEHPFQFCQRSHDFARRLLVRGEPAVIATGKEVPLDEETVNRIMPDPGTASVVGEVLKALTLRWEYLDPGGSNRRHLQPYLGELIHYEFAYRKSAPQGMRIERVRFRGGGILAAELLRTDSDMVRRSETRAGLESLVEDSGDQLGRMASILHKADTLESETFVDRRRKTHDESRQTSWVEQLRDGTWRILMSPGQRIKKIDHLMHWVPYCIARHTLELAYRALEIPEPPTPVHIGAGKVLLRESQRKLVRDRNAIREAVITMAQDDVGDADTDRFRRHIREQGTEFEDKERKKIDATISGPSEFYRSTMSHVGALNALGGLRNYTFKLPLLESIVHATIPADEPVDFDVFCSEILGNRLRLVVDPTSGRNKGAPDWIDNAEFERNSASLSARLQALGLITTFSDVTKKVGPGQ